jgi:hypothetical protein
MLGQGVTGEVFLDIGIRHPDAQLSQSRTRGVEHVPFELVGVDAFTDSIGVTPRHELLQQVHAKSTRSMTARLPPDSGADDQESTSQAGVEQQENATPVRQSPLPVVRLERSR